MSDDDSSVGHPEQQPDSTFGSALDAYFNLNPDKFGAMPTGEFLKLAKKYQSVSESYEKTKKELLELDEKKKELEDDARTNTAVGAPVEQPTEQPAEVTEAPVEEQSPLDHAIQDQEERHEEPVETPAPMEAPADHLETPAESHQESTQPPVEQPPEQQSAEQIAEQEAESLAEPTEQPDDGHPHISHAETDIGAGPAL